MPRAHALLAAAVLLAAVACADDAATTPAQPTAADRAAPAAASPDPTPPAGQPTPGLLEPSPPFGLAEATLRGPDGEELHYQVYVAADTPSRQRGLMERESLPPGSGMVFLFAEDTTGGFWMRNTLIPLDIAFADADGAVVAVLAMDPCEQDPCEVHRPGVRYRTALETNQGELTGAGVGAGWVLELPADLPTPDALRPPQPTPTPTPAG